MATIFSAAQCREIARRRLPYFAFDFIDGGAGRELTLVDNEAAIRELRVVPRALRGAHGCDLSISLFGQRYRAPFGIAPMGVTSIAWPGAEEGLAQTAREMGIPFVLSNAAGISIEQAVDLAGEMAWFQLYHGDDSSYSADLVERARIAGIKVLVLTVDRAVPGWRLRDLVNGVGLEYKLGPRALWSLFTHPYWTLATAMAGLPRPLHMGPGHTANSPSPLDWNYLRRLRQAWPHVLLVKGVLDPADAVEAISAGADGLVISNHGGGHLESAVSSIHQLPKIRNAVGPDVSLLIDSGFRTGEDIAKALILGADFVLLGRAFAFAVAALGPRKGSTRMAQVLSEELARVLPLVGYRSPDSIKHDPDAPNMIPFPRTQ